MVNTKHGKTGTPTYTSWESMRGRCNNPNDDNYNSYGGRGIKVCAEWDDFNKFESDLGSRPEGTSLDRINPDGDYEPSNCRWATTKEQNRNQRRTLFVTFRGETVRLADLAELFPEIGYDRIHQRVFYQGWDTEDAVSRPVVKKPKHNNVSTSPKEDNT
jgi:hypothetical protein